MRTGGPPVGTTCGSQDMKQTSRRWLAAQVRGFPLLRKLPSTSIGFALLLNAAAGVPTFGQTLPVAMTASDIPTTTGIPNNGGEGFRFLGFPAVDGLINWDFTRPD